MLPYSMIMSLLDISPNHQKIFDEYQISYLLLTWWIIFLVTFSVLSKMLSFQIFSMLFYLEDHFSFFVSPLHLFIIGEIIFRCWWCLIISAMSVNVILTLSCILLKNRQTYFKILGCSHRKILNSISPFLQHAWKG